MKRIIVTRFSAMGDVAMVASVLKEFQSQHPDTEIILVSRKLFAGFFEGIPRLTFHEIQPNGRHKGILGLFKLYCELKTHRAHQVADLHHNIRTQVLNRLFKWSGYAVKSLDKGREEKRALIRHEPFVPLKPTTERYADVFRALGFSLTLTHRLSKEKRPIPQALIPLFEDHSKKVGIAPFAQHPYKVWPLQKMEQVLAYLSENKHTVFIFGGGKPEQEIAEAWSKHYPGVSSTIGQYSIAQELDIIANVDLMLSMDSSGMHMASLVGTRCLSIWGATHPYAGFLGYGQSLDDCIQVEHPNRPSSIYGNKACDCDGVEAIELVTVDMVTKKIESCV